MKQTFDRTKVIEYSDSLYVTFESADFKEIKGFNSSYEFKSFGDSISIFTGTVKSDYLKSTAFVYRQFIKPLISYQNFSPFLWKKQKFGSETIYSYRFYSKKVCVPAFVDTGCFRVIEVNNDEEFNINDSVIYKIRVDTVSNFNQLHAEQENLVSVKQLTNCDTLYPLRHLLDEKLMSKEYIVIYSYIGCPPCHVLKKELASEIGDTEVSSRILILNTQDNAEAILRYRNKTNLPFHYIERSEECSNGTFPKIAAYNATGYLEWETIGYDKHLVRRIIEYLD